MRARARLRPLALAVALAAALAASGCPDCPTARAARARVFDDAFATNLLVALAPFVLTGGLAAWAFRLGRPDARDAPARGKRP